MGALKKGLHMADTLTPGLVLGDVSKAHLFDMLLDRARAELGETASDYACLRLMARWSEPVAIARGDKPIDARCALDSAIRSCRRNSYAAGIEAYEAERDHYDDSALEGCWQRVT